MSDRPHHLDFVLEGWPYSIGEVSARLVHGADDREVVQLRVEMGLLQMEVADRPDGSRPGGYATCLEWLQALAAAEGEAFRLDERRCLEIDREFVQFFHRRVAWLALREFGRAVADSDHTLALMDFSARHAPSGEWAEMHEQYRPFVLFHRTQAAALRDLDHPGAEAAVAEIDAGIGAIRREMSIDPELPSLEEELEDDELLVKLTEMKEAIAEQYDVKPPLPQRLAEAIAAEQYELAAELRDQMRSQKRPNR